MSKNPPPYDPWKQRVLAKLAADPCVYLSEEDLLTLDSELYVEPPRFDPPPPPKYTQLDFFDSLH